MPIGEFKSPNSSPQHSLSQDMHSKLKQYANRKVCLKTCTQNQKNMSIGESVSRHALKTRTICQQMSLSQDLHSKLEHYANRKVCILTCTQNCIDMPKDNRCLPSNALVQLVFSIETNCLAISTSHTCIMHISLDLHCKKSVIPKHLNMILASLKLISFCIE